VSAIVYLWVAVGGLAGTFARMGMEGAVHQRTGAGFPWGTLVVNVSGSFLVGFIARLGTGAAVIAPEVRTGLLVGFCGAYTTFSTYSYETVQMLLAGAYARAATYAAGTLIVGLLFTLLGIATAARLL
jgi:fluoride exporter